MATLRVERAMLDTNVLLTATDESRIGHREAVEVLEAWPRSGSALYTSGQILREYYAVAARPVAVNGLGMPRDDALTNLDTFTARLTVLSEDTRVAKRLRSILSSVHCEGKVVHDANIVATMSVHGVDSIVTSNTDDFARFRPMVTARGLTGIA